MKAQRTPITHERAGRFLAGISVLACLALSQWLSPWFLLGVAGTAFNLVLSAITDRCVVKDLLIRIGLPGERDLGRAGVMAESCEPVASVPAPERKPAALGARRLPVSAMTSHDILTN